MSVATSDKSSGRESAASEAYVRLLKGEITSKQFVKTVQKNVQSNRRAAKRAAADG